MKTSREIKEGKEKEEKRRVNWETVGQTAVA